MPSGLTFECLLLLFFKWPGCHQIDCGSIHLRPNTSGWAHASNSISWTSLLWLLVFLIAFSLTVRDLGLTLDQQLTFAPHINRLCRNCYDQLRQQRVISPSLTSAATATLVHAFVTSRLDYCSTLYVGLPTVLLGCLGRVISRSRQPRRTAARLIGGIP